MERLEQIMALARSRRFWQAVAVYIGACFAILEGVDLLIERVGLPAWFFPVALALLALGFPVVLVTAAVQGAPGARPGVAGAPEGADPGPSLRRLLTWRNALIGGVLAFALWGAVAAVWLLTVERPSTSVHEVAAATEPLLAPTSVAVLYFDDFSEGQELGYLADGFTEALIHELSQVGTLRVISRNGVKPYRDPEIPIDSIARTLNVGSLVEGSVDRIGDRLRVTVQLVDGSSGAHLLSRRVERQGDDLLQLRDDVVEEAARLLRERLGAEIELRERKAETTDEAWARVQRAEEMRKNAEELWSAGDSVGSTRLLLTADSLLEQAEELDPNWPEPVILRGRVAVDLAARRTTDYGAYEPITVVRAIDHTERALERWPDHAPALALRGSIRARLAEQSEDSLAADTLRTAAEADLRSALDADPSLAWAWGSLSRVLRKRARFAEARLAAREAYEADAYLADAAYVLFNLCHISIELKEFQDAAAWCDEGRRRFPDHGFFIEPQLLLLASAVGPEPDIAQAWDLYSRMIESYPPQRRDGLRRIYLMYVAAVLARAGLEDSARSVIESARSMPTAGDPALIDYYEANARLRLGEPQAALRLLQAYVESYPNQREYLGQDWWWEELQGDPRFQKLVGGVG